MIALEPLPPVIQLMQNPSEFSKLFRNGAKAVTKSDLLEKLNQIYEKEKYDQDRFMNSNEPRDWKDKKGRYQLAMSQVFKIIPWDLYRNRVYGGDLQALREYVREITLDENNGWKPLPEPILKYKIINNSLRTGDISQSTADIILRLDQALMRIPSIQGIVYRGTRVSTEDAAKLISTELKVIENKAYTSTSVDLFDATTFLENQSGKDPNKFIPALMVINSKTGKLISATTEFEREEEVLIPRNSQFKVIKAFKAKAIGFEKPQDILYLFLEQI